jgi:FkbM family methyltransferase
VTFIQIGAHNGVDHEYFMGPAIRCRRGWSGTLVEPIPELFDQLQARYGDDTRFRLVRAAITDHEGVVDLVTVVGASGMPVWADMLSTIHPEILLKHKLPGGADVLRTVTVRAMTFDELTHGVEHFDVLAIDTEGHDAVILDQVDLARWRPAAVLYEHKHLTTADRKECEGRFVREGFTLTYGDEDTLALHPAR